MRHLIVTAALVVLATRAVAAQHIAGGWHAGGPVRVSLAGGVLLEPQHGEGRGTFLLLEPGLRGGRASVGYLLMKGNLGSGVSVRASVLRTWSIVAPQTYAGGEVQILPLFLTGARLGGFIPTSGPRRLLWIGDLSLGL